MKTFGSFNRLRRSNDTRVLNRFLNDFDPSFGSIQV